MVSPPTESNLIEQALGKFEFSHLVDKVLLQTLRKEVKGGKLQLDEKIGKDLENGNYKLGKVEAFREGCYRLPVTLNSSGKTVHSFCKLGKGKKSLEELATGAEVATFLSEEAKLRFVPRVTYYNPDVLAALPHSLGVLSRIANGLSSKLSFRKTEPSPFYATELLGSEYHPVNLEISHLEEKPERKKVLAQRLVENIARYHRVELSPTLQQKLSSNDFAERGFRASGYLKKINPAAYEGSNLDSLWDKVENALRTQEVGLVHNDLHGGNIYFNPEGDIKIIDWDDATIGVPQLDLCRALMGLGYADGKHEEEETGLVQSLYQRLGKPGSWEDFQKAYELTHLSLRLRLAAGNAKRIQESAEAIKDKRNRREYVQALQDLGSYHLTRAQELMQKYDLSELAAGVADFFSAYTSLRVKGKEWQEKYVEKLGGSIDSCFLPKLEAILKRDVQLPELTESAKEYQQQELQQSALEKYVAAGARKRKKKWGGLAGALAAIVAGITLIGGSLAYNKYVKPVQEKLAEEQSVVESLAREWQPDFVEKLFLEKEQEMEGKTKDGKVFHYTTEKHLLIPTIVSYAYIPEHFEEIQKEWEKYQVKGESPVREVNIKECYEQQETLSLCFPWQGLSDEEIVENIKNRKIEIAEKVARSFSKLSFWKQIFFLQDYYPTKDLRTLIKSFDEVYFTLPGVVEALEEVKGEKFSAFLKNVATSQYAGSDPRFQAHLLTANLVRAIKDNGNLALGYVSVLCSSDQIALREGNKEKVFFSDIPCAEEARSAYFNFLARNGLTPEVLENLVQLRMGEEKKGLLKAKIRSPASREEFDTLLEVLVKLNKEYYQLQEVSIDLSSTLLRHWGKIHKVPGSECEYRMNNSRSEVVNYPFLLVPLSYLGEVIRVSISEVFDQAYPLLQREEMERGQIKIGEAMRSNWESVELARSWVDPVYSAFVGLRALNSTRAPGSEMPLDERKAKEFIESQEGKEIFFHALEYFEGIAKTYEICQKEGILQRIDLVEFMLGVSQVAKPIDNIVRYLSIAYKLSPEELEKEFSK